MIVLEGMVFGSCLDYEGRALMNSISAFIKEAPETPLHPSNIWGHREKVLAMNQEEGLH